MNRPIRPAIAIVAALLVLGRAPADTYTWTVTGGGNWDNGANWTPSTAYPGAADLASFASTSPSGTVTVVGDQPVYGIEYQAGTPGRTISGGTLRLGAGGIVMNDDPAGNETISSNITLTAPVLVNT